METVGTTMCVKAPLPPIRHPLQNVVFQIGVVSIFQLFYQGEYVLRKSKCNTVLYMYYGKRLGNCVTEQNTNLKKIASEADMTN